MEQVENTGNNSNYCTLTLVVRSSTLGNTNCKRIKTQSTSHSQVWQEIDSTYPAFPESRTLQVCSTGDTILVELSLVLVLLLVLSGEVWLILNSPPRQLASCNVATQTESDSSSRALVFLFLDFRTAGLEVRIFCSRCMDSGFQMPTNCHNEVSSGPKLNGADRQLGYCIAVIVGTKQLYTNLSLV